MNADCSLKNLLVLAMRAFCTGDIAPRPAEYRQALSHCATLAIGQVFPAPLNVCGARYRMPVRKPNSTPFDVFASA